MQTSDSFQYEAIKKTQEHYLILRSFVSYYCFCSLNIMTTLITMIPMEIINILPHIAIILLSCVRGITTFCTILSTTFFGGLGGGGGGGDGLL